MKSNREQQKDKELTEQAISVLAELFLLQIMSRVEQKFTKSKKKKKNEH